VRATQTAASFRRTEPLKIEQRHSMSALYLRLAVAAALFTATLASATAVAVRIATAA